MSTERNIENEDTHFYMDNAPPDEVSHVLRVLSLNSSITVDEIAQVVASEYGFDMQRDHSYSPRRLYDLHLAKQERKGSKTVYRLTKRGAKVQAIQAINPSFGMDLLHYLHYTSYSGNPCDRKYLWSYRKCCEIVWSAQHLVPSQNLASQILSKMGEDFSSLDWTARVGARFNSSAAGRVYAWLRALNPRPITKSDTILQPRVVERFELALLSLDDTYRSRQYHYGDAVLMDEAFVRQTAGVFFLDTECCTDLLRLSTRIVPMVKMSDTLGGASINLVRPFSIEDL